MKFGDGKPKAKLSRRKKPKAKLSHDKKKKKRRPARFYKDKIGLFAKHGSEQLRFELRNKYKDPLKNAGILLAKYLKSMNRSKRKTMNLEKIEEKANKDRERNIKNTAAMDFSKLRQGGITYLSDKGTFATHKNGALVTQPFSDAFLYSMNMLKDAHERTDRARQPIPQIELPTDPPIPVKPQHQTPMIEGKKEEKEQKQIEDKPKKPLVKEGYDILSKLTQKQIQKFIQAKPAQIKEFLKIEGRDLVKKDWLDYLWANLPDQVADGLKAPIDMSLKGKKIQDVILKAITDAGQPIPAVEVPTVAVLPDEPPADDTKKEQTEEEQAIERGREIEAARIQSAGKGTLDGLYDDQINTMMDKYVDKGYVGCISSNEVGKINPKDNDRIGFVMNTLPSTATAEEYASAGHWVGVYIDFKKDKSVEYFDPFGEDPPKDFFTQIKTLIDKKGLPYYLKMKINRIKVQDDRTSTCGFHSARFLMDRFGGKPFRECTGFSDVRHGEAQAKALEKKFGFI